MDDWLTMLPLAPVRPSATLASVALAVCVWVADQLLSTVRYVRELGRIEEATGPPVIPPAGTDMAATFERAAPSPKKPPAVVIEDWLTMLPAAPVRPRATLTRVALAVCVW